MPKRLRFPSAAHAALFEEFRSYLDNLQTEGRSKQTLSSYRSTYIWYCKQSCLIEDRRVRRFLLGYENLNTRNKALAHLKSFVSWYGTGNEFVPAPLRVRTIKVPDRQPHVIAPEVANALLEALRRISLPAWAVLTIMRECGMRFGEVYHLTPANLYTVESCTLGHGVTFVGKGNKERSVPLTPLAKEAFDVWAHLPFKPSHMTIRRALAQAEEECGVEHIKPHWFRSTLATSLVNHGRTFDEVAELLGHSSTDVLRKRYARLDRRHLADVLVRT